MTTRGIRWSRLAGAVLAGAIGVAAVAQPLISGLGRAKDGDSLMVGRTEVRLHGIDAPEWDQSCKRGGNSYACGEESAEALSRLVTGKQLMCAPVTIDEHGRTVARCSAGGIDVNRTMVERGHATAFRHYSDEYADAELAAKTAKRGIWAGTFTNPQAWRQHGEGGSPAKAASTRGPRAAAPPRSWGSRGDCRIKGNRNRKGEWIYHLPGMPYYEGTRAEDLFCTEAEARAAGYRRAVVRR